MARKKTAVTASSDSASRVDLAELARILEFMADHGLEELEYQRGSLHVKLRKPAAPAPAAATHALARPEPHPAPAPAAQGWVAAPAAPPAAPVAAAAPSAIVDNLHVVKSPIVGTFYEAPSPGSPPFVKIGDTVKRGQILCIVEAMKLMNEIEADQAGEVVHQLVENGKPVEYGQGLFAIRPLSGGTEP